MYNLDGILFFDNIKHDRDAFYRLDENGDLKPIDYDTEIQNNTNLFPEEN